MPKRPRSFRSRLENLGHWAKRRVTERFTTPEKHDQDLEAETAEGKENTPPQAPRKPWSFTHAREHLSNTFAEIAHPTWAFQSSHPPDNDTTLSHKLHLITPISHVSATAAVDEPCLANNCQHCVVTEQSIPATHPCVSIEEVEDEYDAAVAAAHHTTLSGISSRPSESSTNTVNDYQDPSHGLVGVTPSPSTHSPFESDATSPSHLHQPPPSIREAMEALRDLKELLQPRRKNWRGYQHFQGGDVLQSRMKDMKRLLYNYSTGMHGWIEASVSVMKPNLRDPKGTGKHAAEQLRKWTRAFLADRHALPHPNTTGNWNMSLLDRYPELKTELNLHLQGLGKYVRARDVLEYMEDPLVQIRYGLKHGICLATAQVWMHRLEYRWTKDPTGQFVDGHEREDVVKYRNKIFLPTIETLDTRLRLWSKEGTEIPVLPSLEPHPRLRRVVLWYHDESTFYAHDRRTIYWVPKDATPVPHAKGEGASLMVADFVSADYGWLCSPDGSESARVLFKAGKNREGYFTNEDILEQADRAMDILTRHYPHDEHILVYDNAPTHLKRAADALSARHMSMKPTKEGSDYYFGVEVNVTDEVTGQPVYASDGKALRKKIPMTGAKLSDGSPQSLYFPPDHPRAGVFKGMELILKERNINVSHLKAQCLNFKCATPALDCCCRRVLYNQPDFRDVKSLLEIRASQRGFRVLFLPKFHCELNPIEQCWGYAKREYRLYPPSSLESDLERNVIKALDEVDIINIRRFSTRVRRFMDGYRRGLTGKAAAYAIKKYRGHRVLPDSILRELEQEGKLDLVAS